MNLAFAYLLDVALLARLALFVGDERAPHRAIAVATLVQLIALLALAPAPAIALAALAILLGAAWEAWTERPRGPGASPLQRLAGLPVVAAGFGIASAPFLGMGFRPELASAVERASAYFLPLTWMRRMDARTVFIGLAGALLSLNEANLLVRGLIERFELRPASENPAQGPEVGRKEYARGRVIGLLERLLVFALMLRDDYGALGVVIGIKGLARFRSLDDREFAEYFLTGTLLSIVTAGAIALAVRGILNG